MSNAEGMRVCFAPLLLRDKPAADSDAARAHPELMKGHCVPAKQSDGEVSSLKIWSYGCGFRNSIAFTGNFDG
jgi:hypothetical protein